MFLQTKNNHTFMYNKNFIRFYLILNFKALPHKRDLMQKAQENSRRTPSSKHFRVLDFTQAQPCTAFLLFVANCDLVG